MVTDSNLRLSKKQQLSIFAFLSLLVIVIFYGRLILEYFGYIGFHNFFPIMAVKPGSSLFWNPYYAGGAPILEPMPKIVGSSFMDFFRVYLGPFLGYIISIKLYIIASVLFFSVSFFELLGEFSIRFIPRTIGAIFLLLNPVTFVMLSFGDFSNFLGYGLFFIGLALIIKATKEYPKDSYVLVAYIFLLLSIVESQIFYLGIILFPIFGLFFLKDNGVEKRGRIYVGFLTKSIFFLISTTLVFTLPFFLASPVSIAPTGPVAKPLSIYESSSLPILKLLFLQGTGPLAYNSLFIFGSNYAEFWYYSVVIVVLFLIGYSLVKRARNLLLLFGLEAMALIFGAGAYSPISGVLSWLYLDFPGYQLFPQSYLWDETLIAPFFGIILAVTLTQLIEPSGEPYVKKKRPLCKTLHNIFHDAMSSGPKKVLTILLLLLVIFVSFSPIASQGYYRSPGGINNVSSVMGNYDSLYSELTQIANKGNAGVAFFPGDPYVYYGNNVSNNFVNPLIERPSYRVVNYASGNPQLDNYYYWLYQEFYNNKTEHISELFSTIGVKFFVILNNFSSYSYGWLGQGKNASILMSYQQGTRLLQSNRYYSLYESNFNFSAPENVKNLTLVLGGYNVLNYMAYVGFNLSRTPIIFQADVTVSNYNYTAPLINRVVTDNFSKLQAFYTHVFGKNSVLASNEYSSMIQSIIMNRTKLLEIFTPQNISLTPQDLIIGDSISNKLGSVVPDGTVLHLQSNNSNISEFSISVGIHIGYLGISAVGVSGGRFSTENGSAVFGYSTRFFNQTGIGFVSNDRVTQSNGNVSIELLQNSYSLIPYVLYSNEKLDVGSLQSVPQLDLRQISPRVNGTYNISLAKGDQQISGNYSVASNDSATLPYFASDLYLQNISGLSISYNITGPFSMEINGVSFAGDGSISFTAPLMALNGPLNTGDQKLFVSFLYNGVTNQSYNKLTFRLDFRGILSKTTFFFISGSSIDTNASYAYTPTGYTISGTEGDGFLIYAPYYNSITVKGGSDTPLLGGVVTFISLSDSKASATVESFTYTIIGLSISIVLIFSFFIGSSFVIKFKKRLK